jgi:hypothetical protein
MQRMVGEVIGGGWRKAIERHLGNVEGCTHLRELLFNLASAAFQTRSETLATLDGGPPPHLGQCVSWDFSGPVVKKIFPMYFRDNRCR